MARRTKQEMMVTQQKVVEAALWCFLQRGVAATSCEMVAIRAGYSRGAVSYHFQSKSKLILELTKHGVFPIGQLLEQAVRPDGPKLPALHRAMLDCLIELQTNDRARGVLEIVLRNGDYVPELEQARQAWQSECEHVHRFLSDVVGRAQQAGEIGHGVHADAYATLLCDALVRSIERLISGQRSHHYDIVSHATLDLVFEILRCVPTAKRSAFGPSNAMEAPPP